MDRRYSGAGLLCGLSDCHSSGSIEFGGVFDDCAICKEAVVISSIFKAFAISFAWAALAAAQVSTNIVISAEPIEGNTKIITKCEHVFSAFVDGVDTAFYDVEINAAATGPNPLIGVVPNFGLGIASLKMKIIDKFSGALSFPQVVLTATSTSNFRQIRSFSGRRIASNRVFCEIGRKFRISGLPNATASFPGIGLCGSDK